MRKNGKADSKQQPEGSAEAELRRKVAVSLADRRHHTLEMSLGREIRRLRKNYGMTVIGRLTAAAETLDALAIDSGLSPRAARAATLGLDWVQGAQLLPADAAGMRQRHDPRGTAAASDAVTQLRVDDGPGGGGAVLLEQRLLTGETLVVSLRREWLFGGIDSYLSGSSLQVRDASGRLLAMAGEQALPARPGEEAPVLSFMWEMFLRQRFAAPAWHVVVERPRPTLWAAFAGDGVLFPGLLAASLALVALFSAVAIRRQLQPLRELRNAAERFARRDFGATIDTSAPDEFGDLARTLSSMSGSLRAQFSALEALSEVDRLLLHAPDLERILDALLPRMAAILGCRQISVLLLDPDLPQHGRTFDYTVGASTPHPVQRVCEVPAWQRAGGPERTVHALRRQEQVFGYLSVSGGASGAADGAGEAGTMTLTAGDLADRLSLILANVEHSRQLHRQARYDSLTGLPNRRTAAEALSLAVEAAKAGRRPGALLYVDLDRFKRVNDTAGHRAGDELLCRVAERLQAALLPGELAARLAGDEFVLLAPTCADEVVLARRAAALIGSLSEPLHVAGRVLEVQASIGIALFPRDGTRVDDLLRCADIAMYRAKESGRARALFFEPRMQQQLQARLDLEAGLRRALEQEEFRLAFQPIVPVDGRGPMGVEALVRWPAGDRGVAYPPSEFVPVAEDMGLIVPLGEWVLRTACREFMGWKRAGVAIDYVSVNASPLQLRQLGFAATVAAVLADSGMRPQELVLEVTETVFADGAIVEATLGELAAAGVRLALDDFGTGYSSLSYLGKYPFSAVKIDRSFVIGLPNDPNSCRLVESILAMCAALGKRVVAEGVETVAQKAFLAESGCHALQGYLLARPLPAEELPARLQALLPGSEPERAIA